jgi:hypothetical protein
MGTFVNKGNIAFKEAVTSKIYVDKTELIKYTNSVIATEQRYICSSRPRRFGKSMAAEMLSAYYDKSCDSRELFGQYKITKDNDFEKYINKYNVIYLDIADIRTELGDSENIVEFIKENVIKELKEIYPNVIDDDTTLVSVLSNLNLRTGAEFVIIIDEWDAIFRDDKFDEKTQNAYIDLLRSLFKGSRSKKFTKLAYITGILPIKKYNSESALNNFDEFTMISPDLLSEYMGFTEEEVKALCDKYQMDFDEMKQWYDGYILGGYHVYNPKSVTDAIRRGNVANYWTQTVAYESLKEYISMNFDGLKDSIIKLVAGGHCGVNIRGFENDMTSIKKRDDVITVLIHLGYLAYNPDTKEAYIPNEEVRSAFSDVIADTDWTPVIEAIRHSEQLMKLTWNLKADEVAQYIEEVHGANTSILEYNDENSLSCVITLAYYNAINEYTLIREFPTGIGFADIVFLPRKKSDKPAMVVELKYNKSAIGAIEQIKQKQYVKALGEYAGSILLVGINYDKKSKEHSCVIEWWEK